MKPDTCIIFLGGSERQHELFFPSYFNCLISHKHDLIYVHRNGLFLNKDYKNPNGKIIYENSFIDGVEVEHKAFGKYRYFFNKYANDYKYFAFISDDVILKRDYWLEYAIEYLKKHDKQGAVSPMISNKPNHFRAPIWFAKSECLKKINWEFSDDHDGEMRIADQITDSGYFITQVGEKITIGYDYAHNNGQSLKYFEIMNLSKYDMFHKLDNKEINFIRNKYLTKFENKDHSETLSEFYIPYNTLLEMEPFEGLIYNKSIDIIKDCGLKIKSYTENDIRIKNGLSNFEITKQNNLNIINW